MGLANIDPHTCSHKVETKFYKMPKFGVNRPKSMVSKIQPFENAKITKKCMAIWTLSDTAC